MTIYLPPHNRLEHLVGEAVTENERTRFETIRVIRLTNAVLLTSWYSVEVHVFSTAALGYRLLGHVYGIGRTEYILAEVWKDVAIESR